MARTTQFITNAFVSKYPDFPDHMNELGKFVYYRTYSRFIPELKRRETWKETCRRAVNYNVSLAEKHYKKLGYKVPLKALKQEAEELFDAMFNLDQFLSGRTLWVGGADTGVANKHPLANFNCSYVSIKSYEDFGDLFYLLLVGTGVGFKSTKALAKGMPPIRNNVKLVNKPYNPLPAEERIEQTQVHDIGNGYIKIWVGDSKEGWVDALRYYFRILTSKEYEHVHTITISYNSVRENGAPLKTFGGTASGPEPLMEMFKGIDKVLKNKIDLHLKPPTVVRIDGNNVYVQLRPIHFLDIGNLIGANVVVGGVRRTAEIFLFDADDTESMFAKYGINGIWDEEKHNKVIEKVRALGFTDIADWLCKLPINDPNARKGITHRRMSNNSVAFESKPSREHLNLIFTMMQAEGEPGFVNLEEARRRRPNAEGVNPCAEIILDTYGVCNLTTLNMMRFIVVDSNGNYALDIERLVQAQLRSVRAGLRMTLVELELPHWNNVQQRDRLLGVSMTGVKDAMGLLGWGIEAEAHLVKFLGEVARDEADRYAKELRVNAPLLVTAIKPEGTISQLVGGVSNGLHFSHAPYFIRRVRISANDPMAKAIKAMGWKVYAEVGTEYNGVKMVNLEDLARPEVIAVARTLVVEFPNKSGVAITKQNVGVEEQLDTYFTYQSTYTEHNSSNTIDVKPDEWDKVERLIWEHWDQFTAVSFMANDGGGYVLAPYEEITKEQYEEMVAGMPPFIPEMIALFDNGEEFEVGNGCETGACPTR